MMQPRRFYIYIGGTIVMSTVTEKEYLDGVIVPDCFPKDEWILVEEVMPGKKFKDIPSYQKDSV